MSQNNLETSLGIGLSLLALFLSALGSIFTKKISPHADKLHISALIGLSIFLCSLAMTFADGILLEMDMMKTRVN